MNPAPTCCRRPPLRSRWRTTAPTTTPVLAARSGGREQHPRAVRLAADAAGRDPAERHGDGGALASSGTVSGTSSISYQAADTSSGVRLVQLRVDGEPVAVKDYLASCSYTNFQACPPSVSDTVSWNTATVADGQHQSNSSSRTQRRTRASSIAARSRSRTPRRQHRWVRFLAPVAPARRRWASAAPTGSGQASKPAEARFAGRDHPQLRAPCDRGLRATARWAGPSDRARQPGCASQVDGTATPMVVAHAATGVDGTFSVRLRGGPSRLIEVGYRAFSRDANYAAIGRIRETVAAGVRLRISPTRTGSEGMIVLSGTVEGPIRGRERSWTCWCITVAAGSRSGLLARTGVAARALPVRGRRWAFPVPRRSAWRSGGLPVRHRREPGGECQHELSANFEHRRCSLAGRASCGAAPLMLLSPSMARAETAITTQAVADDGAFLPYDPRQRSLPAFALLILA